MGIGWDYFNNVCQALHYAYKFMTGVVCLIVVCGVGWGVMQFINANRPDPTLIVQPTTTPGAAPTPAVKPNPQFKSSANGGVVAPPAVGAPGVATPGIKANPQFQQPGTTMPANAGAPAAPTSMKPNPQFAPNPQFH